MGNRSIDGHRAEVISVSFSPDGRTLLAGSNYDTLKLWDTGSGRLLRMFVGD